MNSQDAKTELLHQLKIDKNRPPNTGVSTVFVAVIAVLCGVAGLVGGYLIAPATPALPSDSGKATITAAANKPTPAATAPSLSDDGPTAGNEGSIPAKEEILNASGYITARRITTVSSETLGLLASVEVEEGMAVEEGQVLARLDESIATVNHQLAVGRVGVLTAQLSSIESDLAEAQRELQRITKLDADKFSSEAQLSRAQVNVDKLMSAQASAQADIKVARLEVDRQQTLLGKHTIRAPFAGIVTKKNAQPGEIVSPSSAGGGFTRTGICTIVDMDSLEIEVDVNEAFIGRVYAEQKVIATLDAYPNWEIPARVIAIIPTADRSKATVRVRIAILEKDSRILPDMGVKVAFLK